MTTVNHKVNRNTIKLVGDYSVDNEEPVPDPTLRYDNDFVSHPIPSTEFRYRWIFEALYADDDNSQFYPYRYFTVPSELADELISYSNIYLYDNEHIKGPFFPLTTRYADIEGLTFRYKIVNNVVQPGDEFGTVPIGDKLGYTNYYLGILNGPYHWPTWKQVRNNENVILREDNKEAVVSVADKSSYIEFNNSLIKSKRSSTNTKYYEPPFNSALLPLEHSVEEIIREDIGLTNTVRYTYDFANYRVFFATKALDLRLGFDENLTTYYENIYLHYSTDFNGPVNDFYRIKYAELVWPKKNYLGSSLVRDRPYFLLHWRDDRDDRTRTNSVNSQGDTYDYDSMWPLDSRPVVNRRSVLGSGYADYYDDTYLFTTSSTEHLGATGELNSVSTIYHNGDITRIKPSPCFTHPTIDFDPGLHGVGGWGPFFTNDTEFRAPYQVGLKPFADTHADWSIEARTIGKDYAILPEYTISDKIEEYANNGLNFLSGSDYFSASGSFSDYIKENSTESSYDEEVRLGTVFTTSDIFTNFKKVREEHKNFAAPTRIKLEVDAIMKLTPYEGFYPVERTVKLAEIFSQSYADGIIYSGSLGGGGHSNAFRSVLQPLFSPGILFNSIKAGVGYNTVVNRVTRDDGNIMSFHSGDSGELFYEGIGLNGYGTRAFCVIPKYSSVELSEFTKIPFEAILEPEKYFQQYSSDIVCHPSGTFYDQSSLISYSNLSYKYGTHSNKYKIAINNFLAESTDFFLENNNLSALASAEDTDPKYFNFDLSKEYKMRVYIRNSENYDELSTFKSMATTAQASTYPLYNNIGSDVSLAPNILLWSKIYSTHFDTRLITRPTTEMFYRPYVNYNQYANLLSAPGFVLTNVIQGAQLNWDGSSYGEYIKSNALNYVYITGSLYNIYNFGALTFDHITPPYMQGYSFVEYTFRPYDDTGVYSSSNVGQKRFTLQEIYDNLSASYFRMSEDPVDEYLRFRTGGDVAATTNLELFGISGSDWALFVSDHKNSTTRIDDCLDVKLTKNTLIEFDDNGVPTKFSQNSQAGQRLVFKTKWETPIYDFYPPNGVTYFDVVTANLNPDDMKEIYYYRKSSQIADYTDMSASTNQAVGIWYDYAKHYDDNNADASYLGYYPSEEKGIFLQITDAPKQYINVNFFTSSWTATTPDFQTYGQPTFAEDNAASLADAMGFKNKKIRLGRLNKKKIIKEAVVMIPFINVDGKQQYFRIKEDEHPERLEKLKNTMKNYVIPPKFNFETYDGQNNREKINPISMYIFEFEYDLDLEDVSRIWQNVAPKSQILNKKVSIEHDFQAGEIMENMMDDNLQWLVFKVKQKAQWDYNKKNVESVDDSKFNFTFTSGGEVKELEYSYNWPYDFCSVIDRAKIKAEILIETEKAKDDRNRELKLVQAQKPIDSIKKFASKTLEEQANRAIELAPRNDVNTFVENTEVITVNDQGTLQEQQTVQSAVSDNTAAISSNAPTSNPILKTDANTLIKKLRK